MRRFTLRNSDYEVPKAGLLLFRWGALDMRIANQLAFEEQFLNFQRHLLENLQSSPTENPDRPSRPLSLSLRAGAIKSYVVFASSIIEGALAAWGENVVLTKNPGSLYKKTLGGLLNAWEVDGQPREEVQPIWDHLQLLKNHRNFIHLGNAANDPAAYWQEIIDNEAELLSAVDNVINYLSGQCGVS
jgi:hypothetical protein